MKLSEVLIKPILTEKANGQQDKLRRYAFKVSRKANKLEIKKAVEEFYGVNVVDVNTAVCLERTRPVIQRRVLSRVRSHLIKKQW